MKIFCSIIVFLACSGLAWSLGELRSERAAHEASRIRLANLSAAHEAALRAAHAQAGLGSACLERQERMAAAQKEREEIYAAWKEAAEERNPLRTAFARREPGSEPPIRSASGYEKVISDATRHKIADRLNRAF